MSPASSGSLEVERYIGACLISQQRNNKAAAKHHQREFYAREPPPPPPQFVPGNYVNFQRCNSVDVWAGGMPLISFAGQPQRRDDNTPLARLAVHTQGAPLILTKSYNHRKNKVNRSNNKPKVEKAAPAAADTVSVASDESSGSGNSENCLPRIIKPRKRRKKDRKPPLLGRPLSQDGFSTDSASPDIDSTVTTPNHHRQFLPFSFNAYPVPDHATLSQLIATSNLLLPLGDISETPQLHHSFEDIEDLDDGKDINGNQATSTCQCRYCDPSGQIWDVDRSCYSPFLTPPKTTFQFPSADDYFSPVSDSDCLVHSMSSVSLDEEHPRRPARLEVSSEIVTSLNGHRDLEIKFFSTPSAADKGAGCAVNNVCRLVSEE